MSLLTSRKALTRLQASLIVLIVVIAAGGGALYYYWLRGPPPPERIVVGVPISLSGQLSTEGQMANWGVQAAVKWINDVKGGVEISGAKVKIELKTYDDEGKKENVQSLLERLAVTDKVDVILAPYSSGLTLAGAPIAEKYGKLYLSHGGASDRIFEQNFALAVQVLSTGSRYQFGVLDMIKALDPSAKRVAIINEDEEFSISVMVGAREYAKQLGFEVVFDQRYPSKPTDLTPILSALKATNPDIILGGGHFQDGQLLTAQMADLKINAKAVSLLVAPALPDYYAALKQKAEGILGPGQWEIGVSYSPDAAKALGIDWFGPTQDEFLRLFKEVSGKTEPSYHAAEAAGAILVYARGIEVAGSVKSTDVRAALGKMHIMTFFGEFQIDQSGKQIAHQMVIFQWQDGKKVIVWPKAASNGQVRYPKIGF